MRALFICMLSVVAACTPQVATPTPSPTTTGTAGATAPAPASASPVASPAAPPTSPAAGVAGLQTLGLGQLRGDWVFAVRETYVPEGVRVRVEVLAMPLDGTEQRIVASYLKSAGGVTLPPSEVLPRQFSPDGRRLLLNTPTGIVLLELETGSARLLADGQDAVWGYGERVAFIRYSSDPRLHTTSWAVAAAGGAPIEHSCGAALAWTFDGFYCIRPAAGGIVLDSPAPSAAGPGFGWSVALDSPSPREVPISVRPAAGVTVLAVASTDLPRGGAGQPRGDVPYQHQIEVLSAPGAGQQVVVASESGYFSEVHFAEPRWNPRSDQILYRIEGSRRRETHIVDANTKQDVIARISGVARAAEWTPNGEQIVYLTHPGTPIGPATEVRAVRPISGRDDRVLMTAPGGSTFTSVASRGYAATSRIVSSNVGRLAAKPDASAQGSKALEAFAADLYGELVATEPGNLVFSPYSVAAALAMTRAGADGETARQMDEVLHASLTGDLDDAMNALDRALARRAGSYPFGSGTVPLELETANQLWGQHGVEFGQEFLDRLAAYYGAGMRLVDYVDAREVARETINEWVSDRTRARIPELLQKEDLSPNTRLVLTNAIYLKAKWAQHFSTAQPASFHRLDGTTAQMELMRRAGYAEYGRGAAHQTVRLRYVGGLSMVVIVPDRGSFAAVESDWRSGALRAVPDGLTGAHVSLGLPRFEMRTAVKLVPALSALGMPIAFTEQADFSKMSPRVPMLIEAVAHEAFIAVDEHGTEAAAATAVVGGATGGGPSLVVHLTIDRPFMFAIHDDETGAILFMGRVLDPAER